MAATSLPQATGWERPPHAVVGSQISHDERIFGEVFNGRIVRRFLGFVAPYRKALGIAFIAVAIFTASAIAIPLAIRDAIDNALPDGTGDASRLYWTVGVFLALVLINSAANFVQLKLVGNVAEQVLADLRRAMYAHLQRVSLRFMDKTEVGRLMSRLQGDVGALQEFLETSIFAIGDLLLLICIITVLLSLNWELGLLTLSVVPALFLVRIVWLPRAKKAFLRAREASSTCNGALAEGINGVRTVQAMNREQINFRLFEEKARENLNAHLAASKLAQVMIPIVDTLSAIAMGIVVVVGGTLVMGEALDLGVMVAFIFYVQRFFDPIRSITMQYSVMQRAMASGQRIFEVLDVPVEIYDKPDALDLETIEGRIAFKDVTFGYLRDQPVLSNINLTINPGETVALVGPTGSGKSSIASLAHRFYDVWSGQVMIDGHDVRDLKLDTLGREIAMVLQHPYLFTGTVLENIRYNKADASMEDVMAAAKAVGAHDFIMQLPDGYETTLDEGGSNFSFGQRQLISFARAIVADTKILILDEATASIDSYTELQIQKALEVLLRGRTGIVIAHRLGTIRNADRIIVLNQGEIIETGAHDALMAAGGLYARLYSTSYGSFDDMRAADTKARADTQAGAA